MSRFQIDPDVERVLTFMQHNLKACHLAPVARSVAQLAELLWARYENPVYEEAALRPFAFLTSDERFVPTSEADSLSQQLAANEHEPQAATDAKIQNHEMHIKQV